MSTPDDADQVLESMIRDRIANDPGTRTSLDDVLAQFGLDRAALEAEPDTDGQLPFS